MRYICLVLSICAVEAFGVVHELTLPEKSTELVLHEKIGESVTYTFQTESNLRNSYENLFKQLEESGWSLRGYNITQYVESEFGYQALLTRKNGIESIRFFSYSGGDKVSNEIAITYIPDTKQFANFIEEKKRKSEEERDEIKRKLDSLSPITVLEDIKKYVNGNQWDELIQLGSPWFRENTLKDSVIKKLSDVRINKLKPESFEYDYDFATLVIEYEYIENGTMYAGKKSMFFYQDESDWKFITLPIADITEQIPEFIKNGFMIQQVAGGDRPR